MGSNPSPSSTLLPATVADPKTNDCAYRAGNLWWVDYVAGSLAWSADRADTADDGGRASGRLSADERITLEEAIKGYTWGAAFAAHREKQEGSVETGNLADLILIAQDLFKIQPSEIGKTEVLLTMVGGKVVFAAEK